MEKIPLKIRKKNKLIRSIKNTISNRNLQNKAENKLKQKLQANGWFVTKRGYPDFICLKDDKLVFVEVKTNKHDKLKRSQKLFMSLMIDIGIPCYLYVGENDKFRQLLKNNL